MTPSGKSIFLSIAVVAALLIPGPVAADIFEGPDEEEIGRTTDMQIIKAFGLYDDEKVQSYVRAVGKKVLAKVSEPEFEYHFKVVDHEMINAFALPGGYIYVTRGLLAVVNTEADLAGVIGHEIGHVVGHHGVKQMKKSIGQTLLMLGGLVASQDIRENAAAWLTVTTTLSQQIMLGYGREMEMESDQVGMILTHDSGYNPDGIVNFLQSLRTLEKQGAHSYHGFQATHPDTITRIIEAEGKSSLLKARGKEYNDLRKEYLDAVDGLRYGQPKWRGKTLPPYMIKVHTVAQGETFRSIAEKTAGDKSKALEIATLNGMGHNDPLSPGDMIKTIVPAESVNSALDKKEGEKNEVGVRVGDGKDKGTGRRNKTDR